MKGPREAISEILSKIGSEGRPQREREACETSHLDHPSFHKHPPRPWLGAFLRRVRVCGDVPVHVWPDFH